MNDREKLHEEHALLFRAQKDVIRRILDLVHERDKISEEIGQFSNIDEKARQLDSVAELKLEIEALEKERDRNAAELDRLDRARSI